MIKQLQYSESVGTPRDQKTARGALRLLGAIIAGSPPCGESPTKSIEQALKDIYQPR